MNELLPFGEYVPPERAGPSHVLLGMDQYELDRLLASLTLHGAGGGRRSRGQRQSQRPAGRMQAAASSASAAASPDTLDAHMAASASARGLRPSSEAVPTAARAPGSAAVGGTPGTASWPAFSGAGRLQATMTGNMRCAAALF